MPKLIVIRGNSGSGKSTIAKELRNRAKKPNKVALVEQDYLRRIVLKEKETEGTNNLGLIEQTVLFALAKGYDVILEGILYSERYASLISKLIKKFDSSFIFYMNVSLEETLKRHVSKPNAHEFGKKEMRDWYKENDVLGFNGKKIIPKTNNTSETVDAILTDTEL